jgi:hypothetical protein
MNIETGKIITGIEYQELLEEAKEKYIQISQEEMTMKQKEEMQVSLHDNKSKLGKQLQKERKKLTRNQLKRARKKQNRKK